MQHTEPRYVCQTLMHAPHIGPGYVPQQQLSASCNAVGVLRVHTLGMRSVTRMCSSHRLAQLCVYRFPIRQRQSCLPKPWPTAAGVFGVSPSGTPPSGTPPVLSHPLQAIHPYRLAYHKPHRFRERSLHLLVMHCAQRWPSASLTAIRLRS